MTDSELFMRLVCGILLIVYFGGFLAFLLEDEKELTVKKAWHYVLWPFFSLFWILCIILYNTHYLISIFLLLFGVHYLNSNNYNRIQKKLDKV